MECPVRRADHVLQVGAAGDLEGAVAAAALGGVALARLQQGARQLRVCDQDHGLCYEAQPARSEEGVNGAAVEGAAGR